MADPHDDDANRTVFIPAGGPAPGPAEAKPASPPAPPVPPEAPADTSAEDAWFSGAAEPDPAEAAPADPRTIFSAPPVSWDQVQAAPTPQAFSPAPAQPSWDAQSPTADSGQSWGDPAAGSAPPAWGGPSPTPPPPPPAWTVDAGPTPSAALPAFPPAQAAKPGGITVGTLLNGIYEVRRFLARGGMGEVYEGVNINTDERVAIKVMLSHLAQDPNVQAMFRKEARTLTRLSHPAVVQYRVLAQDATLNVFYIVTEFIDGRPLESVLGELRPTPEQLRMLTRRLCEGLKAAHDLGAIHRDMSPDNVLLPDGLLNHAKIIDFGIAKDLDPSNKTIVGDGFAGKLGFVAPEQFGDYGREVGPWTDIYSLALVVMALAAGKPIDMGATLVDAIDKRRMGPDLTVMPESLRAVFAGMLQPDPAKRFRSMGEVIAALDGALIALPPGGDSIAALSDAKPLRPVKPAKEAKTSTPVTAAAKPAAKSGPPMALVGGGIGAVVLLGVLGAVFWPRGGAETPAAAGAPAPPRQGPTTLPSGGSGGGPEQIRVAVLAALPTIGCSWLDIQRADAANGGVELKLVGAAGDPAAAQNAVVQAAKGVSNGPLSVDMGDVFAAPATACPSLDAFQSVRAPAGDEGLKFTTFQPVYEISQAGVGECPAGNARSEFRMTVGAPESDFSIVGIEPSGALQQPLASRAAFNETRAAVNSFAVDLGSDAYRLGLCTDAKSLGTNGMLLLQGRGPFDVGLPGLDTPAAVRDAAWAQRFAQQAKAKGWTTSMVWYRVADQIPG